MTEMLAPECGSIGFFFAFHSFIILSYQLASEVPLSLGKRVIESQFQSGLMDSLKVSQGRNISKSRSDLPILLIMFTSGEVEQMEKLTISPK